LVVLGWALPLLVVTVAAALGSGPVVVAVIVVMWAGWVVALAHQLWQSWAGPLAEVTAELDRDDPREAPWEVRQLKDNATQCQADRERIAALIEDLSSSLGEGLLVVAEDLVIRLINPVALRFCGATAVKAGCHLLEILREPDAVHLVEAAAGGQRPAPIVLENPRGLWEVRAFPVRHGGAVVLISDVGLVRRASELRRRFVQDLSHELRSPLAVLRTTVESLEDEVESQLGGMLVRQVERIDRLVNELHELASIEAGEVEFKLEKTAIANLVREVAADFAPEAERAGVEVRIELAEDMSLECDRRALYRVLSNLVDNAIKYNHPGGWLELRAWESEGGVSVRVSDSGVGIPAGELKAVLQRFYRLDRARTPGEGGLGLGLAIVKHMVLQMGGTLELDSREGVGTQVTVALPAGTTLSGSAS
jgi:signal transduction histidine kinase